MAAKAGPTEDELEERELDNPDNWGEGKIQEPRPERPARAVVSVAFSRDDFERIAARAEEEDKPLSAMIREIVLGTMPDGAAQAAFTVSIGGAEANESEATGAWQPATHEGGTVVLSPS